jgi:hypothetical protein
MTAQSRQRRPIDEAALREQIRAILDALTDARADILRQSTALTLESKENSAILTSAPNRIKDDARAYFQAFDVEGLPAEIQIVTGDGQYAETGHEVGPIEVKVLDGSGDGLADAFVLFTTPVGSGSIRVGTVKTNASGIATARNWRLGRVGTNQLVATLVGSGHGTVSKTITATATAPSSYSTTSVEKS